MQSVYWTIDLSNELPQNYLSIAIHIYIKSIKTEIKSGLQESIFCIQYSFLSTLNKLTVDNTMSVPFFAWQYVFFSSVSVKGIKVIVNFFAESFQSDCIGNIYLLQNLRRI